jgi:thymidylate synthase (FAD)
MENIERARKPEVVLLSHTPDPERIVATAMRQSRFKGGVVGVKLTRDDIKRLIELALNLKHFSVFEHVNFTFAIEGISRSCSHQFVRHRFFSFTQQSQRYVKEHGFPFVIPLTIQSEERALSLFLKLMEDIDDAYKKLSQLVPVEDARFVLPNATETKMVATSNARELMHFLKLRLAPVAQWEIRALAESMFNEVSQVAPNIFKENNIKFFE